MVDHEQPLPHQHSVSNTRPNTRQLPDSSLDDAASTEKVNEAVASKEAEDESNDQNKGGLGAYFRIFRYADRLDCVLYAIAFIGAIIVGAALPLMTLIFGSSTSTFNDYAVGRGSPQQFQENTDRLVLYFVYLFIGRFVIGYVATLCICIAAARTTNSLRKTFLESLLRQEISHFDMQGNGSAATQVTTNGNRINQGIAEKLLTCVTGISLFFSAYVVALAVQWKLALITMSVVPAIILVVGTCTGIDAPVEARIVRIYSQAATIAQDALGSIKTIHAFGAQGKVIKWYDEYLQTAHKEGNKKSLIYGVLFSCQSFLVMSGTALAFWQGFRMFQSGEIQNVGTVFTVVLSVTLGATSVLLFVPQISAITNASSAAAELFSIIDKPSLLDPLSPDGHRPTTCSGQIEFRNIHFAYPTRTSAPVLQGLDLSIPAGKTTALVGPSGCGKSTIVGLLERWYQPISGQITLDGQDLGDYNTNWLRSQIRLVQQEPTLFQGTIFQNVAKGLVGEQLKLPHEDQMRLVREACTVADASTFIEKLPEGYRTQLGERAGMLSGGQRQRLSIARSIISDPKILLCDEATSALDPRAEKAVQDTLNRVSATRTTLVIAHKLATVMAADNIAVMANGRVVEQGTHKQLIEQDGLYAAMVRVQDLGAAIGEESLKKNMDEELNGVEHTEYTLDRVIKSTEMTPFTTSMRTSEAKDNQLTAGTLGLSLARCIFIMLKEHPDLYGWYAVIAFSNLALGGTYPAQAILFSRLINVFTLRGAEARSQANFYALMFFVLALGNLCGYFLIGIATNTIGQTLTHRCRREMLERIVGFDQDFFDYPENSSGSLTSKLSSVPSGLQELMSANLGLMVNVVVNIVASSALGIAFGWKLGLVLVATGISVIVGSGYIRIRLDQKLEAATEKQYTSSASLAAEAVASIKTVSLLTLEGTVLREYSETLDAIVSRVIRNLIPTLVPYALSQSADLLVLALGFWYGSRLIASGEYTVTQFFVVFVSIVFGNQAAAQFFTYTTSITKAKGSANYMLWLRTVKASITETEDNHHKRPSGDEGALALNDVEFRYKQRESTRVLRGISIQIKPGTYAAFVGPSGCGKSTIISLVARFYDPTSGCITLNDEDISLMSPTLYRRYMSLVQQEPTLYLGSVRDNIAIGLDHDPTDEEVREACQQANALDFISSLPEGLNTPCGSRGLQFSGGQRQRIAVARALIRRPRLLLLDEATSALDTQSERIVQRALDEAAASRTTIAVAHRLSTIRHANVIFVIEDGRIVEVGRHEELQGRRGRYHAMCLAQSLDQA
ncbi:Leptomycin B resistance protein pmd1 [Elsinoe australis]|uniref:Leptomycin B resistance protein pmd1 n=1 Tax=Elsinoe australis TaxID=40998 RepID=A0A2P8A7M7_9PEZI|nr:Leptomycin B resistance protein pmd1 [Elsinoe australis]